MPSGTVKWFKPDKGYGFIKPDDGSNDAFVHIRDVEAAGITSLHEGQRIAYEPIQDRRTGKWKAGNLKVL